MIHSSLRTFLKITSFFLKLTYKMINMIPWFTHKWDEINLSPSWNISKTNSISGRSSVGRNSPCQMLMLGRGCGLKSKLPAARQSAPRFYADAVENRNNPNLTGFQFLTPPFITPQQQMHVEKNKQEKKQNIETKTKKIPKKISPCLQWNKCVSPLKKQVRCHI